MDIVVTIPRTEYKNDDMENKFIKDNDNAYSFWTLSKIPKKLEVGDRVYFVKNNRIDSSMEFYMSEVNAENYCEVTNRSWQGCTLYMHDRRKENLDIEVKGFQGFRYKWWED